MLLVDNSAVEEIIDDSEVQYTRLERRALTHKGQLPCQWCWRWVDVKIGPITKYAWLEYVKELKDSPYTLCSREPCVRHRTEVMGKNYEW